MNKTVRKMWNSITTALVLISVIVAFLIVGFKFLGFETYIVLSGSMEPSYPTGSMIYVRDTDSNELEIGDVITFNLSGQTIATHRIIEVVEESGQRYFRTKGDANDVEDGSLIPASHVIGTPMFVIPFLGYLASYLQSKSGFYLMIAYGAALLLLIMIPELFPEEKKGDNE